MFKVKNSMWNPTNFIVFHCKNLWINLAKYRSHLMYTPAISQCNKHFSMARKFPIRNNIISICTLIPKFLCLYLIDIIIIYFIHPNVPSWHCLALHNYLSSVKYLSGRELMCILNPNCNVLFEVCTLRDGFICMKGWICLFVCMQLNGNFLFRCNFWYKWKVIETISIYMKIRIESDLFWLNNKNNCYIYIYISWLSCSVRSVQIWKDPQVVILLTSKTQHWYESFLRNTKVLLMKCNNEKSHSLLLITNSWQLGRIYSLIQMLSVH